VFIIVAFGFPSIKNPFIKFRIQAILCKGYVPETSLLHSIWKTLVLMRW